MTEHLDDLLGRLVHTLDERIAETVAAALAAADRHDEPSPWLTVREGAAYLRVSEGTIRAAVRSGRLQSSLLERRRLLRREDLDALPVPDAKKPSRRANGRGRDTGKEPSDAER